ncbi:hypothetical protein SAVIM40S_00246 [Streptomyces avidinii]
MDDYFTAPEEIKRKLIDYHANTNYSVVDIDLIDDLYRQEYQEKVLGTERLRFLRVSRLADVTETTDKVLVTVESLVTGEKEALAADALVYATGYRWADGLGLLGTGGQSGRPAGRTREGEDPGDGDFGRFLRQLSSQGPRAVIYP